MVESDVRGLRDHGFSDEAIHIAAQVIGYFNYINRIADALHVDDETFFDIPRDEWHAKKGKGYGDAPT